MAEMTPVSGSCNFEMKQFLQSLQKYLLMPCISLTNIEYEEAFAIPYLSILLLSKEILTLDVLEKIDSTR
jgi:hypothetical protein